VGLSDNRLGSIKKDRLSGRVKKGDHFQVLGSATVTEPFPYTETSRLWGILFLGNQPPF
jgi:hypothetical protein